MAPALVESISVAPELKAKATVYMMDNFHPVAVARSEQLFHTILPGTPEHRNWTTAKYLLCRSNALSAADIAKCPNLLAIGKQGVGTDKIDAKACQERGIKIFNTPGVNSRAVAELVLTLTMAVAREVRPISLRLAAGERVDKTECSGLVMYKRRVGIIGMGSIGRTVASIFQAAFDSPITAYDPFMPPNAWSDIQHERVNSVDEVVRQADILTIHVPLTADTRSLISYRELALMKRDAILINAARGGIVNEEDLVRALDEGLLWGAGLDCHEQEPPTMKQYEPLWRHRNVVSLPHVGAACDETQRDTALAAVEKLYEYAKLKQ